MINQLILVGRLVSFSTIENNSVKITLAIPRTTKNEEGIYETDFISINVNGSISETIVDYCKKGDLLGIKGMLYEDNGLKIKCNKVSFLASKGKDNDE